MQDISSQILEWANSTLIGEWKGLRRLQGDASNRSYFRLWNSRGETIVVMKLAEDPLKSEEIVEGERPQTLPFLDVGGFLLKGGIPIPRVIKEDLSAGYIALQDIGDITVEKALAEGVDKERLYKSAIDLMVSIHRYAYNSPDRNCIAFKRRFGPKLLRWELEHFYEWMLVEWTGKKPTSAERSVLEDFFENLVEHIVAIPTGFVHRDFQSRNLMLHGNQLYIIDFQDALTGPYVYDLVALLRDSYVLFAVDEVEKYINYYIDARKKAGLPTPETEHVKRAFHLQSLQRKLKDSGRFVYIDRVKKNPKFLVSIPMSLRYIKESFDALRGEFDDARSVIARYLPEIG